MLEALLRDVLDIAAKRVRSLSLSQFQLLSLSHSLTCHSFWLCTFYFALLSSFSFSFYFFLSLSLWLSLTFSFHLSFLFLFLFPWRRFSCFCVQQKDLFTIAFTWLRFLTETYFRFLGWISEVFFAPIGCTYTSSPLDGMARNYYFLSSWICKSTHFVGSGSILFLPPYTRGEKKNIRPELESNPGPLASQADGRLLWWIRQQLVKW